MLNGFLVGLPSLLLLGIARYIPKFLRGLKRVSYHPGFRTVISPMSFAGFSTPRVPGMYPGFDMPWRGKHKVFADAGSDVISCVSLNGRAILYLADADLIAKINGDRYSYPKPIKEYTVLNFFGPNLVTSEGLDWRSQHAISAPAFNRESIAFLWEESVSIMKDMYGSIKWHDTPVGQDIRVDHVVDMTLQMALLAIANAGFGMRGKWEGDGKTPVGHTMSFHQALHIVAQSSVMKMSMPNWAYSLPIPRLQKIKTAFTELEVYIQEMIRELKKEISDPHHTPRNDLFYNLVRQSMFGDEPLSDEQLQGNIYIFLLAGHETTAHSMGFMLACLALWPEVQDKVHKNIMQVMGTGEPTTYEDYKRLDYVIATYSETLRMFPPIQQIPKYLKEDTIFVFDKSNEHNAAIGVAQVKAALDPKLLVEVVPKPWKTLDHRTSMDSVVSTESDLSLFSSASLSSSSSVSSISSISEFDNDEDRSSPSKTFPGEFSMPSIEPQEDGAVNPPRLVRNPSNCRSVTKRIISTSRPEQQSLFVEKDTIIFVCPPAVHYNPKYYPEPTEFRPERFLGKYDKTTFLPFSSGTRACIGRHFSEVESVCFMAHLLKDFSVHPTPAFPGETREQMKERMFRAIPLITLTPMSIPLTFRRRPVEQMNKVQHDMSY